MNEHEIERPARARIEVAATLLAVKHPGCKRCGAANPKGLAVCACGARLEVATEVRRVRSVVTRLPWHAAVLIRVGLWLRALARRIEG